MKKIISCIIFIALFILSFNKVNEISLDKINNRYYMLREELKTIDQEFDVQIFGSCHAYTSFNPIQFKNEYGIDSYNYANPGEIMPVTYLNIKEKIDIHKPKVILVDLWGMFADDTYIESEVIYTTYFPTALELYPYSKAKAEIINDYEQIKPLDGNVYIARYKSRFTNLDIHEYDMNYNFDKIIEDNSSLTDMDDRSALFEPAQASPFIYDEMENRFNHNGFKETYPIDMSHYPDEQSNVAEDDLLPPNNRLMKYLDKIIQLCEKDNIKVLFYRSPYLSNPRELKKLNYLESYFEEKNVPFYNLEKEILWDYAKDFSDGEHLSNYGARKATSFLGNIISQIIEKDT